MKEFEDVTQFLAKYFNCPLQSKKIKNTLRRSQPKVYELYCDLQDIHSRNDRGQHRKDDKKMAAILAGQIANMIENDHEKQNSSTETSSTSYSSETSFDDDEEM